MIFPTYNRKKNCLLLQMDHVKKRETSVSTADLHNSVKRLAISASTAQEPLPGSNAHIVNTSGANKLNTVLSVANDINFESKYELMQEIGRGGFSVVYKCRERATGIVYACKVIQIDNDAECVLLCCYFLFLLLVDC